jgi:hypothetical protein
MLRIFILVGVLLLSGCTAHRFDRSHCYCPELLTIQQVEKRWGTPNEIISVRNYTWYAYVTKLQTEYPVKQNFSRLSPPGPIAIPVPVTHTRPENSFARYGCSVWYKADRHGVIISVQYEGKYCDSHDWSSPVGN